MKRFSTDNNLLVVRGEEVRELLKDKEKEIIKLVREAYVVYEQGESSLPHSVFLRFPNQPRDRIIGLPAYLSVGEGVAGLKWIASFPENINRGLERASAMLILNSMETGHPYCIAEGSLISAKRTAASAALGAQVMFGTEEPEDVGIVGCGPISFEILRFILNIFPRLSKVSVYDLDIDRAYEFVKKGTEFKMLEFIVEPTFECLIKKNRFIVFATTSSVPYMHDPAAFLPRSRILNVSLRDLGPSVIRSGINITDDKDHANRENTSIHLTSLEDGNMDFVFANLGEILLGKKTLPQDNRTYIFSPFGLGVLDLQVAHYVYQMAVGKELGIRIKEFLPHKENGN